MSILFKNAHIVCPEQKFNQIGWMEIENNLIKKIGSDSPPKNIIAKKIIDCNKEILAPGIIDMRVTSGDPGSEHLENLETLLTASSNSGITSLVILPSTNPVVDNAAMIDSIMLRASRINLSKIFIYGSMTEKLQGEKMAELGMMANAGAVGFSNGNKSVQDSLIMRRILSYASMFNKPVVHHCEDKSLTKDGEMNEGEISTRLGILGMPSAAETIILERDLQLVKLTNAQYHASHISCKTSVDAIRKAKIEGLPVTADTCPPYFQLNEISVSEYNSNFKLNPPLRTEEDRNSIIEGIIDGTIDAISSDHVPVNADMKNQPFNLASPGCSAIETLLPISLRLVNSNTIDLIRMFELLSLSPAKILKLKGGSFIPGNVADIIKLNIDKSFIIEGKKFKSLSRISPFEGQPCEGKVTGCWIEGKEIKLT